MVMIGDDGDDGDDSDDGDDGDDGDDDGVSPSSTYRLESDCYGWMAGWSGLGWLLYL